MAIISIDTSCDETSVAVVQGQRVLANTVYSQILIHKEWGGVVPSLAKRAHIERIDGVILETLKKYNSYAHVAKPPYDESWISKVFASFDAIAVTHGPGLAVALESGVETAKALAIKYSKPLIAVNHMEGHIYSCFVQNRNGNPQREFEFPYLALLASGSHTELVLITGHRQYEVLGESVDDASGEALDKAARMLGFGYPGGPVMEKLAKEVNNVDTYKFPRPMSKQKEIVFSFSGLKTSLLYFIKEMGEEKKNEHIRLIASSFQEAVFDSLMIKTELAIKKTGVSRLLIGGGVSANKRLRQKAVALVKKYNGSVLTPPYGYLNGDNAAMIGVVASFMFTQGTFADPLTLERVPRLEL